MAPKRDIGEIGSEGFALIGEYFDKKRVSRAATTGSWVPQQSCNYRYILSESLVYQIIPSTVTEGIITAPTPTASALNSYKAAQFYDGIHLTNCSNRRQMRMAY